MVAFQFFKFLWSRYVILFLSLQLCFQLTNFSSELLTMLCGITSVVLGSTFYEKKSLLEVSLYLLRILIYKYNDD